MKYENKKHFDVFKKYAVYLKTTSAATGIICALSSLHFHMYNWFLKEYFTNIGMGHYLLIDLKGVNEL